MNENIKVKDRSRAVRQGFRRAADKTLTWTLYVILMLLALSFYIPIVWMLINSLKGDFEYYLTNPFSFPKKALWANYQFFFEMKYTINTPDGRMVYSLWNMFTNSFVYAAASSVYGPFVTLVCAYLIARYKFPGRNFIYDLGIIVMILPIIGTGAASMILRRSLGIYDNMFLHILTGPAAAFSGMGFLMFYAAFKGVPRDFSEAAFIDGAGHLRVFLQIMLPMGLPLYAVFVVTGFIGAWDDWSTFLYWLPSRANIALGMYEIQNAGALGGATMPQILSGFVCVAVPTSIMYMFIQPVMMKRMNVGGLKG